MMNYDIRDGKTYLYFQGEPLYPFGHGLSYTTFKYANLHANSNTIYENKEIIISVNVKHIGHRSEDEVIQLYVKHLK